MVHVLGLNACRCLQDHSKAQRPWVDNEQYSRRLPKSPETKDEAEVRRARMEAARAASNRSQSSGYPNPDVNDLLASVNELSQILFEHPMHTLVEVMLANARALQDDDDVFPPLWTRPDEGNAPDERGD